MEEELCDVRALVWSQLGWELVVVGTTNLLHFEGKELLTQTH